MIKGTKLVYTKEGKERHHAARAKQTREKHPAWKGGRIDRSGYYYLKTYGHPLGGKQGYVAEHRLVMEKHLGRFLTRQEVVHHINHDTKDNKIENLELCISAGQHTKIHHPEIGIMNKLINKGKRRSPNTEFKNGFIPWNKGLTGEKAHFYGRKHTQETKQKMRESALKRTKNTTL